MGYTLAQARAFVEADARIERQRLAVWLGIHAVAAQGDRTAVERLQRELLED